MVLTRGVEEGIHLLNGTSNSLAQELHDMSQSQVNVGSFVMILMWRVILSKVRWAYAKETPVSCDKLRQFV